MNRCKKSLAILLVMITVTLSFLPLYAACAEPPIEEPLQIITDTDTVQKKKTIQLQTNTIKDVIWESDYPEIATVDDNGNVRGVSEGSTTITVSRTDGSDQAQITIFVVGTNFFWREILEKRQILGYRYNQKGNYYYTDDKDCWQKRFGFNFAYDILASLVFIDYDSVRAFFTYEDKDWMIQMWKGQYGFVFYGSEVGVYTKPAGSSAATRISHYNAASEEDFLQMSSKLERQDLMKNNYKTEFERPYDSYWWCTGFVPGHLRKTIHCNELRTTTHITLKDEDMAIVFADSLRDCGFMEVESEEEIASDTYYRDGKDVYLKWQNLSNATNHGTRASVVTAGGIIAFILGLLLVILFFIFLMFGGVGLVIFLI